MQSVSCLLSQSLSPRYSSCTNGDPHHSYLKFQTAVLTALRVTFQVQLSCSESIECFTGMAYKFFFKPYGSNYYRYNHTFHVPHSLYLYT
jgi:hypothetical protein